MKNWPILALMLAVMVMLVLTQPSRTDWETVAKAQKICAEYRVAVDAYVAAVEQAKKITSNDQELRAAIREADRLHEGLAAKRRRCQEAINLPGTY